jgi:transposase-like protein
MRPIDLTTKPNYRQPWSDEDLAQMVEMLRGGRSIRNIAGSLGRSQDAVRFRAAKKRLSAPRAAQ